MLSCQRDQFSLPDTLHYLNCAYMSPLPRAAEAAGIAGVLRKRDPSRITPADFFTDADRARERFARLINAPDPRRVAIIPAASYGLAVAARNLVVGRGRNVVVAHEQFPSNVYAWRSTCADQGLELRTVAPPAGPGRAAAWNERLLEAIDRDTAVVALGHVHWADGTRFDLERIGARARECGAALVVDGTQSVGALPLDVQRVQPDAVVCAAYKWLLGPYSIGLAYFGPRFDHGVPLEQNWITRQGSEDFQGLVSYRDEYQPGALRYDVGERSNFALLPMVIASLELLLEWRPERIQEYCAHLTRDLVADARELGFSVEEEAGRAAHLFGLRAPAHLDLKDLQRRLHQREVVVSLRGSALRVSPHLYNDRGDIDALREGMKEG